MQQTVDIEDKASGITAAEQEQLARKFQKELNAGLVALVLLAILDAAEEDLYGYQIAKRLEREGGPVSLVKQGAASRSCPRRTGSSRRAVPRWWRWSPARNGSF